ncbi:spore coat protein GerQ [Anoxybacteroides amylolyticum]|uniref:Spore coat protein GerQ n=1 Tax=Anoxybacteroides amylolyticum TaxID=294699 RepID=A0A160F267_9BACL|nr:spore coat protein GerQ [Anoxybacillus amylolyticus]ANB59762.1 spore coat protein GerQ [Anoxybacillus amylolyticus]
MTYEEERPQYSPYSYGYYPPYYPTAYPYSQQMTSYQPTATPGFSMQPTTFATQPLTPTSQLSAGMLPLEQSYIENILRLNKGKIATVYMTFENNREWNAKIFRGAIEAAGRDHLILSDPQTGKRYLLPMIYLNYVTFDEEIAYEYPYAGGAPGMSSYTPR